MGRPTMGSIGFGWWLVSGRRRVPWPPAMTTPFTRAMIPGPLRPERPERSGSPVLERFAEVAGVRRRGRVVLERAHREPQPSAHGDEVLERQTGVRPGDGRRAPHQRERGVFPDGTDVDPGAVGEPQP